MQLLKLAKGSHQPGNEACLMEMVAYLAGEKWSDKPRCSCPVIASYGRALNDELPDDLRPMLTPYIPRLVGTRASAEIETRRGLLAADYAVRVFAPIGLRTQGREDDARTLQGLAPIVDERTALSAASAATASAAAYSAYAATSIAYSAYSSTYAAASASSAAYDAYSASDSATAYSANAHNAANAANAASVVNFAAAFASWDVVLPHALRLLDEMIAMGPGAAIPDDWFTQLLEAPFGELVLA